MNACNKTLQVQTALKTADLLTALKNVDSHKEGGTGYKTPFITIRQSQGGWSGVTEPKPATELLPHGSIVKWSEVDE